MTKLGTSLGIGILVVLGLAVVGAGWLAVTRSSARYCEACQREVHSATRTIGSVEEGSEAVFCCPTCVVRFHLQTGRRARIVEFSDYETGDALTPGDAVIVEGSRLNHCVSEHRHLDANKQPGELDFDRCAPSIFAFEREEAAREHVRLHGGEMVRFEQLSEAARH